MIELFPITRQPQNPFYFGVITVHAAFEVQKLVDVHLDQFFKIDRILLTFCEQIIKLFSNCLNLHLAINYCTHLIFIVKVLNYNCSNQKVIILRESNIDVKVARDHKATLIHYK